MWNFEQFSTVGELWEFINIECRGKEFKPVRKRWHQEKLEIVLAGVCTARLIKRIYEGPTSISVSAVQPNGRSNQVTKLDFTSQFNQEERVLEKSGHLMLPRVPGREAKGTHVVTMEDFPPESEPYVAQLERGLDLLLPW